MTRCLFVSASHNIRGDQVVEMTAKIDTPIMSVTLVIVLVGESARTSRFSSNAASRQGEAHAPAAPLAQCAT